MGVMMWCRLEFYNTVETDIMAFYPYEWFRLPSGSRATWMFSHLCPLLSLYRVLCCISLWLIMLFIAALVQYDGVFAQPLVSEGLPFSAPSRIWSSLSKILNDIKARLKWKWLILISINLIYVHLIYNLSMYISILFTFNWISQLKVSP